jgi:hypothetical protein
MNGFKNMSMALAHGLMFYVRAVFEVEDPSPMVAALLRRRDLVHVALLIQFAHTLNDPSEARETLRWFMTRESMDYDLIVDLMPSAYWLYCGPNGDRRGHAPANVRPVFKGFVDGVIVAGAEDNGDEPEAKDSSPDPKLLR